MSLEYETQTANQTVEQERGVERHTHNGIDTPRIKFSDLDKFQKLYSLENDFGTPYPGVNPDNLPTPPTTPDAPILTGDYATDYTALQTYLDQIQVFNADMRVFVETLLTYIRVSDYWIRDIIMVTLDRNKLTGNTDNT